MENGTIIDRCSNCSSLDKNTNACFVVCEIIKEPTNCSCDRWSYISGINKFKHVNSKNTRRI